MHFNRSSKGQDCVVEEDSDDDGDYDAILHVQKSARESLRQSKLEEMYKSYSTIGSESIANNNDFTDEEKLREHN